MKRRYVAMVRRANRIFGAAEIIKTKKSIQKQLTGLVAATTVVPSALKKPKTAKPRKAAAPKVGRSLGIVFSQLRAAQSLWFGVTGGSTRQAVQPRVPTGAQYLARTYRCTKGSCSYRFYLPASQSQRPRGLIMMLHGCNQTPDDFAVGTHMNSVAERHGLAVAYPAQSVRHNPAACWNWFKPADQSRGAGEPAMLAALARKLARDLGLDRRSVFVCGFSAGGAMAAILADVYPDVFSAAGIHSGLARGAARDAGSAVLAMRNGGAKQSGVHAAASPFGRARRIVFQGDGDSIVHPANLALLVAAAVGTEAAPVKVSTRTVRGRSYTRSDFAGPDGEIQLETWLLHGGGHAWSGGRAAGSYTDNTGPDASAQMVRFFLTPGLP